LTPASVHKTAPSAASEHQAAPASDDAMCGGNKVYGSWLNQDVRYIISPPERAAFESLKTVNECDSFVEQFWSRRNPVPGSPENKFKSEHYRRIAYANVHFGSSTGPGWQSSRGRTYITYGPPDESQVLPNAGPGSPKEAWVYQHVVLNGSQVKLTVEFIDEAAEGNDTTHVVIDLENPK
jgi:GWxTD domain-containing protein